jgi:hypothetical protein
MSMLFPKPARKVWMIRALVTVILQSHLHKYREQPLKPSVKKLGSTKEEFSET